MTFLELVNKVLVRLREDQVATSDETTYSTLIAEFVREALSEVEDARAWNALRTTITVPTVSGSYSYSLTGAGASYEILYIHENTLDYDVGKAPSAQWMTHQLLSGADNAQPQYYDINGSDDSGDPVINVYPVPDAVYSLDVAIKVKTQSAVDATVILIPTLPIILRAYALALDERGDDAGDTLVAIERRYERALADATTYDAALNPDETVWYED